METLTHTLSRTHTNSSLSLSDSFCPSLIPSSVNLSPSWTQVLCCWSCKCFFCLFASFQHWKESFNSPQTKPTLFKGHFKCFTPVCQFIRLQLNDCSLSRILLLFTESKSFLMDKRSFFALVFFFFLGLVDRVEYQTPPSSTPEALSFSFSSTPHFPIQNEPLG